MFNVRKCTSSSNFFPPSQTCFALFNPVNNRDLINDGQTIKRTAQAARQGYNSVRGLEYISPNSPKVKYFNKDEFKKEVISLIDVLVKSRQTYIPGSPINPDAVLFTSERNTVGRMESAWLFQSLEPEISLEFDMTQGEMEQLLPMLKPTNNYDTILMFDLDRANEIKRLLYSKLKSYHVDARIDHRLYHIDEIDCNGLFSKDLSQETSHKMVLR